MFNTSGHGEQGAGNVRPMHPTLHWWQMSKDAAMPPHPHLRRQLLERAVLPRPLLRLVPHLCRLQPEV